MAQARILVTGAGGTLGQDLLARLQLFQQWQSVGTTSGQLNLSWDALRLVSALSDIQPDVIINTAAFTQVDTAEADFETAMRVNAYGPRVLAAWVHQHRRYLIHISTDYVFDGTKGTPYLPADPPNPINQYGQSKLAGEQAVLEAAPAESLIIRTSWLFGPGGKNFVPFILNAAQAQTPIRVAMDQWGTPTWTGNLCKMILSSLKERETGIRHGCSRGSVTRYEQARFLCRCLGYSTNFMTPVATEAFGFAAKRPENTTMETSYPMALDWREATEKFLQTQGLLNTHV